VVSYKGLPGVTERRGSGKKQTGEETPIRARKKEKRRKAETITKGGGVETGGGNSQKKKKGKKERGTTRSKKTIGEDRRGTGLERERKKKTAA